MKKRKLAIIMLVVTLIIIIILAILLINLDNKNKTELLSIKSEEELKKIYDQDYDVSKNTLKGILTLPFSAIDILDYGISQMGTVNSEQSARVFK